MSFGLATAQAADDTDFAVLEDVNEWLSMVVRDFESGAYGGADAAVGVALFATIEKMAAAGKALCAARVAETRHWRVAGDRTAAHWVARHTGCSMGEALAATQVPERLRHLPDTDAEFRAGGLTLTQSRHITEAAMADPTAEAALLEMARREALPVLREQCQRVIAAACEDDEARYRKVHNERFLRHWTDSGGAFRMDISTTPDAGAEVLAALQPIAKKLGRHARRNGCKVRNEALMVDALVELCRPTDVDGSRQRPRYTINITADRAAWIRGGTPRAKNAKSTAPVPSRSRWPKPWSKTGLSTRSAWRAPTWCHSSRTAGTSRPMCAAP